MSERDKRRGFSLHVFLPDGDPEGLKVVEKSNWTGHGLVIPRPLFGEARIRPELGRAGVYILLGPSESSSMTKVYIGEGDPVRPRLEEHAKKKDFWTHAVAFTSTSTNLNKAHVQHLEARLVEIARTGKRCILENGNSPTLPSLSEADVATVEGYLDDLLLCLPVLGYGFFESSQPGSAPKAKFFLRAKGIKAEGFDSPAGFIVLKGSEVVKDDKLAASTSVYARQIRSDLLKQGVLTDAGQVYSISQDYTFSSPSMAADVILGTPSNGRLVWKAEDNRTLKEVQEQEVGG